MPSENVAAEPLHLRYTLTTDDVLDGFAAQSRSISRPWYLRRLSPLLTVGVIAVVFVSSAVSGNMAAGSAAAVAVMFVVLVLFALGVGLLLRRLSDRSH
jgi:hypothetical protein